MAELPRGTVSLLFTDIEGSTQLQHRLQERYREVVNEHRRLLEGAIESNGGQVVDRQTESFFAAFRRMRDAAAAAAAAQRALATHEWPDGTQVKVRMGIHAGEPELEDDRYVGLAVSRAARIAATAHGGQVVLSGAARGLLTDERFRVRSIGSYALKDFDSPEPLFQLQVEGLPDRFPRPRVATPRSRRRALALGLAVAAAALSALVAFLANRDTTGGLSGVQPNHLGLIDPETNEIVAEVPVGIRPGPVADGAGSVWVGNLEDRTLTRVDSEQRAATATISLDRRTPTGVAVGGGAVWVAHGRLGQLSRVDPQFNELAETIDVAPQGAAQEGSVAVGAGAVWAAYGESTLARIDPAPVRAVASSFAGAVPAALVVARGSVWVANAGDATVSRFDPTTLEEGALRTISVGRRPTGIAYGADAIWVANAGDGTVTRIDPSSYSTTTIPVGSEPVAVAVGAGAVWVANSADRTVSRIDPATNEVVRTIEIQNAPAGIAVAAGSIWLAVAAP